MSIGLTLSTAELSISATNEEISNCLKDLVNEDFATKLPYYMDEIDKYELKDFILKVLSECYMEDDDYYSYECQITQVYNILVISIAYIN